MSLEERVAVVEVVSVTGEPPVVVDATATVRAAIRRMRESRVGYALITRADKLAGIFTERDLLLKGLGAPGMLDKPVTDLMTHDPGSVSTHDSIRKAVTMMQRGGFRNVPVVDEQGRPVACVRHKDIIAYLVDNFADRVLNVPPDPDQIAKTPDGA